MTHSPPIQFLPLTGLAAASLLLTSFAPAQEGQATETVAAVALDSTDYGPTPLRSVNEGRVQMLTVPAQRGTVTTAGGHSIAVSRESKRITARLLALGDTPGEIFLFLRSLPEPLASLSSLDLPGEEAIAKHLKNRPWLPCPMSKALSDAEITALKDFELPDGFGFEMIYRRAYPLEGLFAHSIGYIGEEMPRQHGPVAETEYLWSHVIGRSGLEKTLNKELRGGPGEIIRLYNKSGELMHHEVSRRATQGCTVVTSLNLEMQRLAVRMLAGSGRPGAFVAVDADSGDILAMASYPSFDPNLFVPRISHEQFNEIADHPKAPFFDRALTGAYPPGSTFKPFVALAGMINGTVDGIETRFPGPATMDIGGRVFKNWDDVSEGPMDLRYALMRSTNTWFYQAGLETGSESILNVANRFGFGKVPEIPLPAVGSGNLPNAGEVTDAGCIASVSIGQGAILVSPLQLALSMAGLANGDIVPKPRLVRALKDPDSGKVIKEYGTEIASRLSLDKEMIELVREGMWAVVNHKKGTARVASIGIPAVYGKTGTSQWAVDGKPRSLAWFAGWVDAKSPRIAFAAVSQGRHGEMLSGGGNAAPIAAGFLKTAYGAPERYSVTKPDTLLTKAPTLAGPYPEKSGKPEKPSGLQASPVETVSVKKAQSNPLIKRLFRRRSEHKGEVFRLDR